ncbi:hypothetical protein [Chryseobacterium binzhouense]|uniref:hypothetical protein n=1 Tax=Chryseobacterium binzhouense TaxID=2593646 RepID=UPI00289EA152|nr:hypothetical protein [Chryseobacterium binzhouense]
MKKIFLVLFLLISTLLFTQCVQYKKTKKMRLFNKELVFPVMTSEYEKLTTSQLQKAIKKKDLAKNGRTSTTLSNNEVDVEYKEYDQKNDHVVQYVFNTKENIVGESIYQKIEPNGKDNFENSMYFIIEKSYYSDGTLRSKRLIFDNNSLNAIVLKQFEYDEKGNLIKEFDISKIYKLSLIDVLKILEKNNLSIDFNNASVSAGGISYLNYILYKETNHGKIWIVGNGLENFQAIIYDEDGDILVKKDLPSQKVFLSMERWLFDDTYKGKTIEEVEKETGIKIFVYNN